jgi:hypothetical protein
VRTPVCLVVSLGLACTHSRPAPPVSWDTEAGVLAAGGNAAYAWLFYDSGMARYVVGLHGPTQRQACESYSQLGNDADSDYWYMALAFGGSGVGIYQAVPGPPSSNLATTSVAVELLHRYRGTFQAAYGAMAGDVTITVAPTVADFRAGRSLWLSGRLSWPAVPRTSLLCSGSFPVDGGVSAAQASCLCEDPSGVQSTCDTGLLENCCAQATDDNLLTFEIPPTEAKPCLGLCNYVAGLPNLCSQELTGASGDGAVDTRSASTTCQGTPCEGKGWPSVAVRLASDQVTPADVQFVFPDGRTVSGDSQGGCPMWAPQIPAELSCQTGIVLGIGDTEIVVRVAPAGLMAAETTVEVGPKNYCAANIAYITASTVNGAVEISTPEYRSPCAELGL